MLHAWGCLVLNKYDELKSYLPDIFTSIKDVDVFLKIVGLEFDKLENSTFIARNNNFINLSDEKTISSLEKFMYIPYNSNRTLADRKNLIISFFTGNGKIGITEIKEVVKVFTTSVCDVLFADSTITIKIIKDISETFILSDCYFILRKKVPAHLKLEITIVSSFFDVCYVGAGITSYKEEVMN